jgi:hypothetical protein
VKVEYGGCHLHIVHTTKGVAWIYDSKAWWREGGGKDGKRLRANEKLAAKLNAFMEGKWSTQIG